MTITRDTNVVNLNLDNNDMLLIYVVTSVLVFSVRSSVVDTALYFHWKFMIVFILQHFNTFSRM